jgi:TRAP-type C4-dicarboxylate transport system substrate-binding protein
MSFSSLARAAVAALVCLGLATSADATRKPKPKFQIKFATLAPDGSTWMKTMHAIDDEVRARTENRVGFKFYPGGVQGDEEVVLRKIRNGQLHSAGFTGFGLGTVVSDVRVMELPFLFESLDELDHLRGELADYFDAKFDEAGWVNLGWTDVGFIYLMSKNEIRTPDDMKHAKMWIWSGDPLAELFFRAFDISPIPLAAPDVLTSLQTGIIDVVYASPLACVALQWFTRIDYMNNVPLTHGLGAILVSKKSLRKVSPEDLAIVREVAAPHLRELTLKTREQNGEAIGEMEKEGVQVLEIDEAVRADFYKTGRAAWKDGVGSLYPQELLDRVIAILEAYRAR